MIAHASLLDEKLEKLSDNRDQTPLPATAHWDGPSLDELLRPCDLRQASYENTDVFYGLICE
jgi:hypothetical protein